MEEGMVSVDKFSGGSQAYFLTHLHQDHTRGLGATGGWCHGPLYCSPTTAPPPPHSLPRNRRLPHPPARPRCLRLPSLLPHLGLPPLRPRHRHPSALHCPDPRRDWAMGLSPRAGSVMYLFRGDLGCMLYTGDFRWELGCEKARRAKQALLDALGEDIVDVLYLDNTYCHPSLNFPPRPVVAEQVRLA
ncbi:hypothetical protein PR202_gb04534 [Eleusine coracana subsp. coracana]|uniref:Metallo-beta-lactamase domain-containing protein n=1 Tax=Eleusine coracana subsp. coracana TaxID=191504 RepID=A0AAV5E4U5_ELECO|nr:hypothetical protein PR202_gb04534 [Eleusine coracana subsp. coracana]